MSRTNIYDDDWRYSLIRKYVRLGTRLCYRKFHVIGKEKIPQDGSLIYVSNHTGSLMDPLVQLAADGNKIVFMARADVFKNPSVIKLLNFLRILPVYRIRDGYTAVKGNDKVIEQAVEVLRSRTPLALYPEGTHRTKHSLLRLNKGVFHIALEAERRMGGKWPVYIVPMGIEYGDYFRFRPTLELEIGDAIRVDEYITQFYAEHASDEEEQNEARLINAFRNTLTDSLSPLFSYIPDDEDYEAIWELTKIFTTQRHPRTPADRKRFNQEEISSLLEMRKNHSTEAAKLFSDALSFKDARQKPHVSIFSTFSTDWKHILLNASLKGLLLLILLPLYLFCGIVTAPIWITGATLAKRAKDNTWRNTWRFAPYIILMPIITILVALFAFSKLPWYIALVFTIFTMFGIPIVYDWAEHFRRLCSDWVWLFSPQLREQLQQILKESH